jgi:hypothetical protein
MTFAYNPLDDALFWLFVGGGVLALLFGLGVAMFKWYWAWRLFGSALDHFEHDDRDRHLRRRRRVK